MPPPSRRTPGFRFPFLAAGLLAAAALLSGCASSGVEEEGFIQPRPDDCEMYEAGLVRLERHYAGRGPGRSEQLRAMGYDRLTDVRTITETWRDAQGEFHERVVGWEGIGWRWNDPACRLGR